MQLILKKDKYYKRRKGYSQFYNLYCEQCAEPLGVYQKDGRGILRRLYMDRISNSTYFTVFKKDKKVSCRKCNRLLALGYIFPKETRPSYAVFAGAVKMRPVSFWQNIKFIFWNIIKD